MAITEKIMQGRVIILMHCTPQYDLSTYEDSSYIKYFLRYALDKNVGRKDRRTETISISPPPFRRWDDKI
jgi:hypothetical protein